MCSCHRSHADFPICFCMYFCSWFRYHHFQHLHTYVLMCRERACCFLNGTREKYEYRHHGTCTPVYADRVAQAHHEMHARILTCARYTAQARAHETQWSCMTRRHILVLTASTSCPARTTQITCVHSMIRTAHLAF